MPIPNHLLGIFYALTSAVIWGSGDFSGGLATRRSHPFHVLALSALSGMVPLILFAGLWGETLPTFRSLTWALVAGISGAVGLAALYRGLAVYEAARIAPVSAVIGAALPVGFGMWTEGVPNPARVVGFVLAFVGIWLVSQGSAGERVPARGGLFLAGLAGVGFGGYFILIAQVEHGNVFLTLVGSRFSAFCVGLLMIGVYRLKFPSVVANPIALLSGVLDALGNVFYLLAQQITRLDVAVVLASLFPATTVLLAAILLKEKVSRLQMVGVGVCLLAIALISM